MIKRIEEFKKERERVQNKTVPISEHLLKINQQLDLHIADLTNGLDGIRGTVHNLTFRNLKEHCKAETRLAGRY